MTVGHDNKNDTSVVLSQEMTNEYNVPTWLGTAMNRYAAEAPRDSDSRALQGDF